MRIRAAASDARHQDVLELEPLLRWVVRDPDTVHDLVQEALARVIAARERLDDEAVTPYAIVTDRNLVTSLAREQERGRRHRPRLVDLSDPERPEDAAPRQEEPAAVEAALAGLPDHEREAVVATRSRGSTPPPWPRPGARPPAALDRGAAACCSCGGCGGGSRPGRGSARCWPR